MAINHLLTGMILQVLLIDEILGMYKSPVNDGINYQPQPLQDFWTINSIISRLFDTLIRLLIHLKWFSKTSSINI